MLSFYIPGRTPPVAGHSYAKLSADYLRVQESSGEGASSFPAAPLSRDNKRIGEIAYNGRVWLTEAGTRTLVYCPASAGIDEGMPAVFNAGRESVWGQKCPNPHATGTTEHEVFERGAAAARAAYVK